MWNLDYADRLPSRKPLGRRCVIELTPDAVATARFNAIYEAATKADA
jgi:hypothetical protein